MSLSLIALLVAAFSARVNAQCQEIAGNYYCASTDAIIYNNVGFSGTYNEITSMDSTSCACSSSPQAFSGGLAPLNEEVRFIPCLHLIDLFRSLSISEDPFKSVKSPSTTARAPQRRNVMPNQNQNPTSTVTANLSKPSHVTNEATIIVTNDVVMLSSQSLKQHM